jgi:hypothetical protein
MRATLRLMMYAFAMLVGALLVTNNVFLAHGAFVTPMEWIARFLLTEEGRIVASCLAAVLLLSPLGILLRYWQATRRARDISYQTEHGRISVNLIAVEEALTRAIEGEPEVKKAHVRVYEDRVKRVVMIEAVMTLWEVPNVTDRNRFCQRLLRRRFAELMPERTAVEVNLSVHRLTTRGTAPAPAPTPSKESGRKDAVRITPTPSPVPDTAPGPPTSTFYRDPLLDDTSPLSSPATDEDLYLGPSYPVVKDDDEDGTGQYTKPSTTATKPEKSKQPGKSGRQR